MKIDSLENFQFYITGSASSAPRRRPPLPDNRASDLESSSVTFDHTTDAQASYTSTSHCGQVGDGFKIKQTLPARRPGNAPVLSSLQSPL